MPHSIPDGKEAPGSPGRLQERPHWGQLGQMFQVKGKQNGRDGPQCVISGRTGPAVARVGEVFGDIGRSQGRPLGQLRMQYWVFRKGWSAAHQ